MDALIRRWKSGGRGRSTMAMVLDASRMDNK
jgi:hypothetical protein